MYYKDASLSPCSQIHIFRPIGDGHRYDDEIFEYPRFCDILIATVRFWNVNTKTNKTKKNIAFVLRKYYKSIFFIFIFEFVIFIHLITILILIVNLLYFYNHIF